MPTSCGDGVGDGLPDGVGVGDGMIEGSGDGDGPMDGVGDALTTLRLNTAWDPAHDAVAAQRQKSMSTAMARI